LPGFCIAVPLLSVLTNIASSRTCLIVAMNTQTLCLTWCLSTCLSVTYTDDCNTHVHAQSIMRVCASCPRMYTRIGTIKPTRICTHRLDHALTYMHT
jgi:hypothetical protein